MEDEGHPFTSSFKCSSSDDGMAPVYSSKMSYIPQTLKTSNNLDDKWVQTKHASDPPNMQYKT